MSKINIGLLGFGTVGSGVYEILSTNYEKISKEINTEIIIKKICVKNIEKNRKFGLNKYLFTDNIDEVIENPEIDIVIEVMGGIENTFKALCTAIKNKKHIISANKDLFAKYGYEITSLAKENGVQVYFEAAVAGGIPILKTLKNNLYGNNIKEISGIVNGSTNYILTRMELENLEFENIVEDAKNLGFLEADPSADLDGIDAARKCAILSTISFNSIVKTEDVYCEGISKITLNDIQKAKDFGYRIKLLANAKILNGEILSKVHPMLIPYLHPLASVNYELNSVFVSGDMVGETMYYGRGAGSLPTGSAVVGDLIAILKNMKNNIVPEHFYNIYNDYGIADFSKTKSKYFFIVNLDKAKFDEKSLKYKFNEFGISILDIKKYSNESYDEFAVIIDVISETEFKEFIENINEEIKPRSEINTIRVM